MSRTNKSTRTPVLLPRTRLKASAGALAAALVMAACGSDGGGGDAGGDGSSAETPSAAGDLSETEKSRIAEEYRDCMAEGGLEATVDYGGDGLGIDIGAGDGISEEEMLATEAACEPILADLDTGGPELSPEEEAELADALLEVQSCLAEEGYVITVDGNGINLNDEDQPADFDEAAYLELEDECLRRAAPELYAKYGPEGE